MGRAKCGITRIILCKSPSLLLSIHQCISKFIFIFIEFYWFVENKNWPQIIIKLDLV